MSSRISLWHVLWLAPLCIFIALLIAGCAIDPIWVKTGEAYPVAWTKRLADTNALNRVCRDSGLASWGGCTYRSDAAQRAYIYLGPDADTCTLDHELAHAAGWQHPGRDVNDCGPL